MVRMSRRGLLKGVLGAGVAPLFVPGSALGLDGGVAASERVTMGCIGLGGRGTVDMEAFLGRPDVRVVALCDVDAGSTRYEDGWNRGLAPAVEKVTQKYGGGAGAAPAGYNDFRELLARRDVDAVCIGAPDHWHAAMTVAAARAGKDVYCEKPLATTIGEGRAMADAVRRHARVFQCGSQRRSDARCRRVCELVRNGRVGKLKTVHVGLKGDYWIRKNAKQTTDPEPVPAGFDYDLWLGPAPWAAYTFNRCHWNFRWNLDYSGGNVTDWGAHMIDMAHWGMGAELTGPVAVEGTGTFPPESALWNAAKAFDFTCTYADGVRMVVKSGGGGVKFEGTDGWINLEGKASDPRLGDEVLAPGETRLYVSDNHHGNFIDCVRTRGATAAPAEVAHRSITPAHLGNIAMRLGRRLAWDPAREVFVGDDEANRMVGRVYRGEWGEEV